MFKYQIGGKKKMQRKIKKDGKKILVKNSGSAEPNRVETTPNTSFFYYFFLYVDVILNHFFFFF